MSVQVARVSGAHPGAFSQERVFIHRLSLPSSADVQSRHSTRSLRKRVLLRRVLPAAVLFCALLFHLFVRIQIIHAGYRLHAAREGALKLDRQSRELHSILAEATCPKKILERAEKELGLTITPPQRMRTVTE